jgi:hypothetical protein
VIYIKKSTSNAGAYSVRIDGVKPSGSKELPPATYVQITDEPQEFADDVGAHILQTHSKFVMQVDAPAKVSKPATSTSRLPCPVEECGRDYANETTLTKHINETHQRQPLDRISNKETP